MLFRSVLLDLEFEAHVSDFGTSKIMSSDTSYWTSFAGTIGYAAPGMLFKYYMDGFTDSTFISNNHIIYIHVVTFVVSLILLMLF